jgi:hypothetical protein
MRCNNIEVRLIQRPVLKVWTASQLKLSEVLLTWLAGSMFEWGGFNGIGGGGQGIKGEPDNGFAEAQLETFVRHPWWNDNMAKSEAYAKLIIGCIHRDEGGQNHKRKKS